MATESSERGDEPRTRRDPPDRRAKMPEELGGAAAPSGRFFLRRLDLLQVRAPDEVDHEPDHDRQCDPSDGSRASQPRRQLEERHGEHEDHDVADQLEHPLERERREDLGALHVRGARHENDARRFAAVGDENVVEPRAGERRPQRQPEGRHAGRPQENPPAHSLERQRQQIHDRRGKQDRQVRLGDVLPRQRPVHLAREQHESRDDRDAEESAERSRDGLVHAASSSVNR